jgi:DNA-binding Lrp family transcriptional regulator
MVKKYSIPRYIGFNNISYNGENLTISLGYTKFTKKELDLDRDGLEFLLYFLNPRSVSEAVEEFNIKPEEVVCFIESLEKEGIIKVLKHDTNADYDRYDRHMLYYDMIGADKIKVQDKLKASKVGLIGMGGIGNWVSLGLIGAGLGEIRLIDFDRIELSNLTRQVLFDESDIGSLKIESAKTKLEAKNRDTKISIVEKEIKGEDDIVEIASDLDIIILSADTPPQIHTWLDHRIDS